MRKFFIVLITGVVIISAIALYFIVDNFNINAMDTTERMTFFLQVLAGFVTACISTWGLSIAHRQIKHWEIEQCDEFLKEYDVLKEGSTEFINDFNANKKISNEQDKKTVKKLKIHILNFWEDIALLEKKSYLDSDILYDSFYTSLFSDLEGGVFDDYLKECFKENKHLYYHTRILYIKWKERYNSEKDHKDLEKSWEELQKKMEQNNKEKEK